MNRYLLDTNILAFLISGDESSISHEIQQILRDHSNLMYTNSVAMAELLQLYRINKIQTSLHKSATEICKAIENDFYIEILPFSKQHLSALSKLEITKGHNDPFDHAIISQAIAEKMVLISSDRQFENYTNQKLNFVFNKR